MPKRSWLYCLVYIQYMRPTQKTVKLGGEDGVESMSLSHRPPDATEICQNFVQGPINPSY